MDAAVCDLHHVIKRRAIRCTYPAKTHFAVIPGKDLQLIGGDSQAIFDVPSLPEEWAPQPAVPAPGSRGHLQRFARQFHLTQ